MKQFLCLHVQSIEDTLRLEDFTDEQITNIFGEAIQKSREECDILFLEDMYFEPKELISMFNSVSLRLSRAVEAFNERANANPLSSA